MQAKKLIRPEFILFFCSTTRPGAFLLPPGWDASPSQGYIRLGGERESGTVRVKCKPGTRTSQNALIYLLLTKLSTFKQFRKQEVAQYLRCLVYILRFYKYHFQIFSMSEIWNGNRIFSILSQQRDMPRRDIINFETKQHCGLSTLNLKDLNSIAIRLVVHFPVIFVHLNNIVAVPEIWKSKRN